MTERINADVIKAWAEGEPIQVWSEQYEKWIDTNPNYFSNAKFRIKPAPKVLKTKRYVYGSGDDVTIGIYIENEWVSSAFMHWIDEDWVEFEV